MTKVNCALCRDTHLVSKPSENLKYSDDTEVTETATSYTKKKEKAIPEYAVVAIGFTGSGKFRIKFDLKSSAAFSAYGRIYKNGVAVGTERINATTGYITYTEDIEFKAGDLVQIYAKATSTYTAYVRNFRIYCDGVCLSCGYDDSMLQKHIW